MGEGMVKPKLECGVEAKKPQHQWVRRHAGAPKKEFKAPTPGLEHMIFKQGDAADVTAYADVKKALAKYAGVNFKVISNMAQVAIDKLKEPAINKMANPLQMFMPPAVDEEVMREEWRYQLEDYFKNMRAWDDAWPRAFQLVVLHVDSDLEERLESLASWSQISQDQDVIELLKLIRAHVHQHDEVKQDTMALVEHDLALYLNY